jgi:hypothetical protein
MEETEIPAESSFFSSFSKILSINIPENQPPILFKYKTPEKKLAEEIKKKKELKHKKLQKLNEKKRNYQQSTDIVREKSLRKIALKGIIKIFNEISAAQFEQKDKKQKEGARKLSERFKRRIKRLTETTETRKMIDYSVEKPKWNVLSEDFLKVDKVK